MPEIPRTVLASTEYAPILSLRFGLRCALCLVLTACNAGVVAVFGPSLYHATAGYPLQFICVSLLFAALLGSLVRVWIALFSTRAR